MKAASQITDRAKRYRANRNPPPGPRRCNFCASRRNIDIDHVTGDESDDEQKNKIYLCRPCNTRKGITQARHRIGIRTRQFNPFKLPSFSEFRHSAAVLLGLADGDPAAATQTIHNTPPEKRVLFGDRIEAEKRKNPDAPTFAQYARAVSIHCGGRGDNCGSHDEGGAIIHATPKALRHRYAQQIARTKSQRRGEVPF